MQTLRTLIAYIAATVLLVGSLSGGIALLVQADASTPATARVASIPPRIAESIERKAMFASMKETAPVHQVSAAPVPMQEANVSLTMHTPRFTIRELSAPAQAARTPRKQRGRADRTIRSAAAATPGQVAAEMPRMGRSDFPY